MHEGDALKIAAVEDDCAFKELFREFAERFGREEGTEIELCSYDNVLSLLFEYRADCDCVFLDIDLPSMNGIEGAKKIRTMDRVVPIVFITSFSRYAVEGYDVDALEYLQKPVSYAQLSGLFRRLLRHRRFRDSHLTVSNRNGTFRIPLGSILYIRSGLHYVHYVTDSGTVSTWGTMKDVAQKLSDCRSFARCGVSYLVNLSRIRRISGTTLEIGNEKIQISRDRKKEFLSALNEFYSDSVGGNA